MKNRLIKFILSFTNYDKVIKENERLKKDIYILIEKQGGSDYMGVISRWKLKYQLENAIWFGSREGFNKLNGIINTE